MFRFLLFAFLAIPAHGARILAMYPFPSLSHQVVYRSLMLELARRGHEVVVITTDVITQEEVPANYTQIDVHDISYKIWREKVLARVDGTASAIESAKAVFDVLPDILEHQFQSKEVQKLLHSNQHFDLVFAAAFTQPAFVLSHIYKAPLIMFSSFGFDHTTAHAVGAPHHIFFNPELIRRKLFNLTMFDKLIAFYDTLLYMKVHWELAIANEAVIKKLFPSAPSIKELINNIDMVFLGVNALWDDNRPVPPSVIYTGALHMKPPRELPTELKAYLDNSKHGVIYMSFGTNVDPTRLSPERIKVFCDVFSKLPYDVLWKWNGEELPGKPKNVRISKWLPQADLLKHPNVKLFITQAGLQSTDEAIAAGVPLLAFPIITDQRYNSEKYEYFGIGKKMDFGSIDENTLENAIESMIGDKSYKENLVRLRTLMRDKPDQPLERAVWWTEYVLRHKGAKHLRSPQANISWSEYLCLDVVLVLLAGFALVILVLGFVLHRIWMVLSRLRNLKLKGNKVD